MRKLFITWQDKESRNWFTVGMLTNEKDIFKFVYLNGALEAQEKAGFGPLVSFPDFDVLYESNELFPVFMNRVMPRSRPDFLDVVRYLDLPKTSDPFEFLARTGGAKATDTFEVFPYPTRHGDWHRLSFFAHGLRYMPEVIKGRINSLIPGEELFLMHDFQNSVDNDAMMMRTEDSYNVGYCPSYLLDELRGSAQQSGLVKVKVEKVNNGSSPLQFRLLCNLSLKCVDNRKPFSSDRFQPIQSRTRRVVLHTQKGELRLAS